MDAKGWVLTAVEKLGWAGEREIVHWLDEAGEELSRRELKEALAALVAEGALEHKGELYRRATPKGPRDAFDALFEE